MNPDPNNPNNPNNRDDIAAVPVGGSPAKRYGWLLLLIPLLLLGLLLPRCGRNDANRAADATSRTADDAANATRNAAANTADAARNAGTALINPFTVNTTGPDVNKAVLNFDANSTAPNTDATGVLNNVAAYLKANPSARVTLRGYTDNSGPADVNRQLTERRIASVKSALSSMGVDTGRIAAANFGEAYPVTDNSTPQARELNRRVEIELAR